MSVLVVISSTAALFSLPRQATAEGFGPRDTEVKHAPEHATSDRHLSMLQSLWHRLCSAEPAVPIYGTDHAVRSWQNSACWHPADRVVHRDAALRHSIRFLNQRCPY